MSETARLRKILDINQLTTVIDVGANVGQFAAGIRDAGFKGRIVSFEPLEQAHRQLCQNAAHDPDWIIADRMAIGDRDGSVQINISGNSASSSVLPMCTAHSDADPASRYVGSEEVAIARLDTVVDHYTSPKEALFIKIDVQGFEREVLSGAFQTLTRTIGIQLELSLVSLYQGQQLFGEALDHLRVLGFDVWSLAPGMVDNATGRMLQVDGIFIRNS